AGAGDGPTRGRANDDDGNGGQFGDLLFFREESETIHHGHGDVEHDHVGPPLLEEVERVLAMLGVAHGATDVLEDLDDQKTYVSIVFDDQDIECPHLPALPNCQITGLPPASGRARTAKP